MKKITIFLFSFLLLIACDDDPNKDNLAPTLDEYPISTWLSMNSEEFSEWVALLNYTGMYNTMNLNTEYTAFVPTNEAMDKYLTGKGYASVESMTKEEALQLVKYHTIKDKAYSQNEFGDGILPDTTATGDFLTINFIDSRISVNGTAFINQVDVPVTNGVIHTLDAVLNPISSTIWDEINATEYSVMAEAIRMTGYDEMLVKIREGRQKFQYTFFAVSDKTFAEYGISSIDDLIDEIGVTSETYTDPENELNIYVAYHIFNQQIDILQLATFPDDNQSKNIPPVAPNQLINVSVQNSTVYINYDKTAEEGIQIIDGNINTKNGLIHLIDNPMFMFVPEMATVTWELTDYPSLSGIVKDYRNSGLRNNVTSDLTTDQKIDFYKWETSTADNMNNSVKYIAFGTNDLRYNFLNHDALRLRLNLFGWIEMESPTIVKGKYTVKVHHYSTLGDKNGLISIAFDGSIVGSDITINGNTSMSQIYTSTLGTVTFDKTSSHLMRIMQGDQYEIFLDRVEFIPVQ